MDELSILAKVRGTGPKLERFGGRGGEESVERNMNTHPRPSINVLVSALTVMHPLFGRHVFPLFLCNCILTRQNYICYICLHSKLTHRSALYRLDQTKLRAPSILLASDPEKSDYFGESVSSSISQVT